MNYWSIILISIGVICVAISLLNSRHPAGKSNFIAIHDGMCDERIKDQFNYRHWRVDATLGIKFGAFFIAMGLALHAFLYIWWI